MQRSWSEMSCAEAPTLPNCPAPRHGAWLLPALAAAIFRPPDRRSATSGARSSDRAASSDCTSQSRPSPVGRRVDQQGLIQRIPEGGLRVGPEERCARRSSTRVPRLRAAACRRADAAARAAWRCCSPTHLCRSGRPSAARGTTHSARGVCVGRRRRRRGERARRQPCGQPEA